MASSDRFTAPPVRPVGQVICFYVTAAPRIPTRESRISSRSMYKHPPIDHELDENQAIFGIFWQLSASGGKNRGAAR